MTINLALSTRRPKLPERAGTPAADVPTLDDFLVGLREMRAELAECSQDLASVRAGIAEVRRDLDGLIEQVAELRGRVGEPEGLARRGGLGCVGLDGLGCDVLGCRCDCDYWNGGCEHPPTPDEVAKIVCPCGTRCTCFDVASPELVRA